MASFDNYVTLQATILSWLIRPELAGSVVQSFILLAEKYMNRRLRTRWQENTNDNFVLAGEFTPLPADHIGTRSISLKSTSMRGTLRFVTPAQFDDEFVQSSTSGTPSAYTIVAGQYRVVPTPTSGTVTRLIYWKAIPALATASTNWLLENYPEAYLYGALYFAEPYLKNDERIMTWKQLFEDSIKSIIDDNEKAQYPGPLIMRPSMGDPQDYNQSSRW